MPALFTSTSMPPCHASAWAIAASISFGLARSIDKGRKMSGCEAAASRRRLLDRAVPATRCPAEIAAFASDAPRPLEAPVMNQLRVVIWIRSIDVTRLRIAARQPRRTALARSDVAQGRLPPPQRSGPACDANAAHA